MVVFQCHKNAPSVLKTSTLDTLSPAVVLQGQMIAFSKINSFANLCKQVNYSITKHLLVLSGNAVCINIEQKINYHNNLVELINLCNVAFFF